MASAYRRHCKHCNRWISLRQMPAGQWVAFENEAPHVCERPNRRSSPIKKPVNQTAPQKDSGFENFEMPKSIEVGSSTGNNSMPPPSVRKADQQRGLARSSDQAGYIETKFPSSGMPKEKSFNWSWLYLLVGAGIILKLFAAIGRSPH